MNVEAPSRSTKLVNQALGAAASLDSITDDEIARAYAARVATDFTLPPAVHVRHIRVKERDRAARVATEARNLPPGDEGAFAALAAHVSEDVATRANGGDLGFIDGRAKEQPALVAAALALRSPGDVAGPVPTEEGYEIVRLVERRAAAVSPLAAVAEQIRQRLYQEHRAKALESLLDRLRSETKVEMVAAETPSL